MVQHASRRDDRRGQERFGHYQDERRIAQGPLLQSKRLRHHAQVLPSKVHNHRIYRWPLSCWPLSFPLNSRWAKLLTIQSTSTAIECPRSSKSRPFSRSSSKTRKSKSKCSAKLELQSWGFHVELSLLLFRFAKKHFSIIQAKQEHRQKHLIRMLKKKSGDKKGSTRPKTSKSKKWYNLLVYFRFCWSLKNKTLFSSWMNHWWTFLNFSFKQEIKNIRR